jgi:hypothetical protein
MRGPFSTLAFVIALGCSIPELKQPEPKITMAPWPKTTNTLRQTWLASQPRNHKLVIPFQKYDDKLTAVISKRWRELASALPSGPHGTVVADFKLTYDGQVTDLNISTNELQGPPVEICRRAILESAPFDPWPAEMRRVIGSNKRDITLRFYYQN